MGTAGLGTGVGLRHQPEVFPSMQDHQSSTKPRSSRRRGKRPKNMGERDSGTKLQRGERTLLLGPQCPLPCTVSEHRGSMCSGMHRHTETQLKGASGACPAQLNAHQ